MRRYEIVHIFARRLGAKVGRVQAILSKLTDAAVVSGGGDSKRYPADMDELEISDFLTAVLAESGITTAADAAKEFGALYAEGGEQFSAFLADLLFGPHRAVRHLMVRQNPPGVSVIVDGQHVLFGEPPSRTNASPARIVAGETLSAIAAELQGQSPEQADAAAELARLQLTIGRAA